MCGRNSFLTKKEKKETSAKHWENEQCSYQIATEIKFQINFVAKTEKQCYTQRHTKFCLLFSNNRTVCNTTCYYFMGKILRLPNA